MDKQEKQPNLLNPPSDAADDSEAPSDPLSPQISERVVEKV